MTTDTLTIGFEQLEARHLVREIFTRTETGELDYERAAMVLSACGIPTTWQQVETAVSHLWAIRHPAAAIEAGAAVHGKADTHRQAEDSVRATQQLDLDLLVSRLVAGARPVSVTTAVLEVLTVMGATE